MTSNVYKYIGILILILPLILGSFIGPKNPSQTGFMISLLIWSIPTIISLYHFRKLMRKPSSKSLIYFCAINLAIWVLLIGVFVYGLSKAEFNFIGGAPIKTE